MFSGRKVRPKWPLVCSLVTLKDGSIHSLSFEKASGRAKSASRSSVKVVDRLVFPILVEYPHSQSAMTTVTAEAASRATSAFLNPMAIIVTEEKMPIRCGVLLGAVLMDSRCALLGKTE